MTQTEGQARADAGAAEVIAAATSAQRVDVRDALASIVIELACQGRPFTAEAVRAVHDARGGLEPHSPNLIPAMVRSAAQRGLIAAEGFTSATRASRHGGALRIWRGVPEALEDIRPRRRIQLELWADDRARP